MEQLRSLFPPKPVLTEENLPDQTGKVFLVTGASSGIGEALANILYQHQATVYLAARSEERTQKAIDRIKASHASSQGKAVFLHLDLNDLTTIKATANKFVAAESQLHVLWLNAGVSVPPWGSRTAQGYELQLGTNNLAHFLLARYLHPVIKATTQTAPKASVRVVWVSSSVINIAPDPPIDFDNLDFHKKEGAYQIYARSKAGNVLHAVEYARRFKDDDIISVTLHPGILKSGLQKHMQPFLRWMLLTFFAYEVKYGAYTELFAGLSPAVGQEHNGAWIAPWGRIVEGRKDLWDPELGVKYWEWTEDQLKGY